MKKALSIFGILLSAIAVFALADFSSHVMDVFGIMLSAAPAGALVRLRSGSAAREMAKAKIQDVNAAVADQALTYIPSAPPIDDFTFNIANSSADVAGQTAVLFNASTLVTGLTQGAQITTSTGSGPTYTNFLKQLINSPFCISGFTYIVEDQSQYTNAFVEYIANGSTSQSSNSLESKIGEYTAIGNYENQLGFFIKLPRKITSYVAWTILINPESTAKLIFKVIPESQLSY